MEETFPFRAQMHDDHESEPGVLPRHAAEEPFQRLYPPRRGAYTNDGKISRLLQCNALIARQGMATAGSLSDDRSILYTRARVINQAVNGRFRCDEEEDEPSRKAAEGMRGS